MRKALIAATLFVLMTSGCTTSDVIMTGASRPAVSPDQVQFYLRAPEKYQSIGLVTASSNSTPIRGSNKKRALEELKQKAAQLGANGIILTETNGSTGTTGNAILMPGANAAVVTSGRGTEVEVQGEAIFVER